METAEKIAEKIYYHQDQMEATVRAMHLPRNEFIGWAVKNEKLLAYSIGMCEIYLPMIIMGDEISDSCIYSRDMAIFLHDHIQEILPQLKKAYHERFTFHKN